MDQQESILPPIPVERYSMPQQNFANTIPFRSYRLLITSQRADAWAVQYAEAEIIGLAYVWSIGSLLIDLQKYYHMDWKSN